MFSETMEKFVLINVNTTSTLPKLSMSERPLFLETQDIKGQLTVIP